VTQHSIETSVAPVSAEQHESYHADGFLILRQFFAPDRIARAAASAEQALQRKELISTENIRCRWQDNVETGQCQFDAFDPILDLAPECGDLATDTRLIAALSTLYGEEACLFKDKLIFKPPGSKGYALHQDYISWSTFPRSFLTVVIPIDPCDADNGCTEVYAGYHHNGCMVAMDGDYHELPAGSVDPARAVNLALDVGDVGIFGGFVPHRSNPNRSSRWRRQLYLSYNALSDGGHQRDAHYREFQAWLVKEYAQYGRTNVYFR